MTVRLHVRNEASLGGRRPIELAAGKQGLLAIGVAIAMASCQTHAPEEGPATTSSAINASPTMPDFVLYAQRSISLGPHDSVSGGDLGVRTPTISTFGPQLVVSDHVTVDSNHNLLAPSITLGSHSAVGDVQTSALQNNGATLGAQAAFPASLMPPLPLALLSPSGLDLTVASHQTITLDPGNYGTLTVADHASVSFNAGSYSFSSVTIADHTSISTSGAGVTIGIGGTLSIAGLSTLAPASGEANKLVISLSGVDASGSAPVASIGSQTSLTGLIAAPHGTISLSDHVSVVGALAAFDIAISDHTDIQFQSGFPSAPTRGSQQLTGYVTPQIAGAPVVKPVPPTSIINFAIGLPVRDAAGLQNFIQQVSDPSSSSYRQYLTVDQFASTYGATASDYSAIVAFAVANGFSVLQTFPNNIFLQLSAPASVVESAFFVNLNYLQGPDGSLFFAPDQDPSINTPVGILRISGLDTFGDTVPQAGSAPDSGQSYEGSDFRHAYAPGDCAALDGTGQRVGLLELDTFDSRDLSAYESEAHLPDVAITTVDYIVATGGGDFAGQKDSTVGSRTEVALDIDVAAAMAPGATIVVYRAPYLRGSEGANIGLNSMATAQPLANQLSSSWIKATDDNTKQSLAEMAAQGQSFFQSSGDNGASEYNPSGPQAPVSYPIDVLDSRYAVAEVAGTVVGGTVLSMNGSGVSYNSESGWSGSGGGVFSPADTGGNAIFIPDYQRAAVTSALEGDPNMGASTVWRNAPDVAMPAQSIRYNLGLVFNSAGGTSAATPLWAAYMALVNQQGASNGLRPVGFANPALYVAAGADAKAFNDILPGNNGFNAGKGYDLVTGLGSPTCELIEFLGGGFPSSGGSGGGTSGSRSITVAVKGNEGGGPDVCVNGTGFPPGATVHVQYQGIPGTTVTFLRGPATVATDGTFSLDEFDFGSIDSSCTEAQLTGSVTVSAIDSDGHRVTTEIAAEFWCEAGLGGGEGTCP